MSQDFRIGGTPITRDNYVFQPNQGRNLEIPGTPNPVFEQPAEAVFTPGGGSQQIFPRNSWQSPEAQFQEQMRAQENLGMRTNFRRHPGLDLFGPGDLAHRHRHHHDHGAAPVYGSPLLPPDHGAAPVYGAPVFPKDHGGAPVYGSPWNPVDNGAAPVYGAPYTPPDHGGAPVYGSPNF